MPAAGTSEVFTDVSQDPFVRGFLHRPEKAAADGLVLAHGSGGNCGAPLLIAVAEAFADAGVAVLRIDLPFRQTRPYGPPSPADAKRDRAGIKNAMAALKNVVSGRCFVGGQSYGGRQCSMLCAEEPGLAAGLLLLSYPLHLPGKLDQLRTQHLPDLRTPTLFVQGTRDPFGAIAEIEGAVKLIPAKTKVLVIEGTGHDLGFKGKTKRDGLPAEIRSEFEKFFV